MRAAVRRALPADAAAIGQLRLVAWRIGNPSASRAEHVAASELLSPDLVARELAPGEGWDGWLVAVRAGEVVGIAAGGLDDAQTGRIHWLHVAPAARGRGIGSALLDAVTAGHVDAGALRQVATLPGDDDLAIRFLARHGFAELRGEPAHDGRDGVLMRRALAGWSPR